MLPPEAFAGAIYINAAGIVLAIVMLALDWLRRREPKKAAAISG